MREGMYLLIFQPYYSMDSLWKLLVLHFCILVGRRSLIEVNPQTQRLQRRDPQEPGPGMCGLHRRCFWEEPLAAAVVSSVSS